MKFLYRGVLNLFLVISQFIHAKISLGLVFISKFLGNIKQLFLDRILCFKAEINQLSYLDGMFYAKIKFIELKFC